MTLQKLLGFDKQKMSVRVEVIGGLTTFLTMCYILAVNPAILSTTGMDKAALFTGTAVAAGVATVATVFHFLRPALPAHPCCCNERRIGDGWRADG